MNNSALAIVSIKQHADKLHLLFHDAQSTLNSVCCHQELKMRGSVQGTACHVA
jgi:hypothetical protein